MKSTKGIPKAKKTVLRQLHYYGLDNKKKVVLSNYYQVDDFLGRAHGYTSVMMGKMKYLLKANHSEDYYAVMTVNGKRKIGERTLRNFYSRHEWPDQGGKIFKYLPPGKKLTGTDKERHRKKSEAIRAALTAVDAKFGSIKAADIDSPEFKHLQFVFGVKPGSKNEG